MLEEKIFYKTLLNIYVTIVLFLQVVTALKKTLTV